MMKKILVFLTFVITMSGSQFAYADFEPVETALGKLEDIQKEAQNVQEKLKSVLAEINAVRQGISGVLKKHPSNIFNEKKVEVRASQKTSKALEEDGNLEQAVKDDTTAVYTNKNQIETYRINKDKRDAIRRENLARLYAYALTLRTNMAKNRKEHKDDDQTITAKDKREILHSAATKEAMENARRLAHIWDMQSSIFELYLIEQTRLYSDKTPVDSDEGE